MNVAPSPRSRALLALASVSALAGLAAPEARAASILAPGDNIIAIDLDAVGLTTNSSYPAGESPALGIDQDSNTKYLNFAGPYSGLIVAPASGASTIQSFIITTANDAEERDPTSFELYGTNEAIASTDNSRGEAEAWTAIATGAVDLPAARFTAGSPVNFTNNVAYTAYKLLFPTLKGGPLMQIADVQFYTGMGGAGSMVLAAGDSALAIHAPPGTDSESNYPANEGPGNVIDGDTGTKYLNFGEVNSGFIVTPGIGSSVVRSFQVVTANDAAERDPTGWELFGTNDAIMSEDNSLGDGESWTLIDTGSLSLPDDRFAPGAQVPVNNETAYSSYRMVFTGVKDEAAANSMQIAEVQFFDVIPEPSPTLLMAVAGLLAAVGLRRRARA